MAVYLEYLLRHLCQELQMNILIDLLAQQGHYRHPLEFTLQHLHIQLRYLHQNVIF